MIGEIKSKQEIALGTLEVTFQVSESISFKPGQYCFVSLPNLLYPDDRGGKRHFSIVNSPNEKGIVTIATKLRDSGFKKTLNELPLGSNINLGPISGAFTLPDDTKKPLIFIAGGIGITLYISMLRFIKEEGLTYEITLIYSNRDSSSAAYLDELETFTRALPNFKLILTMTDDSNWTGEKRRVDTQFIKDYTKDFKNPLYLVVGPPAMIDAIRKSLNDANVAEANIKFENFTGY